MSTSSKRVVPVKVITHQRVPVAALPTSPIIDNVPILPYHRGAGLNWSFMDDSLRVSPASPKIGEEIASFVRAMVKLFKKDKPEISECIVKANLRKKHPENDPAVLIDLAVEHRFVYRRVLVNGTHLIGTEIKPDISPDHSL